MYFEIYSIPNFVRVIFSTVREFVLFSFTTYICIQFGLICISLSKRNFPILGSKIPIFQRIQLLRVVQVLYSLLMFINTRQKAMQTIVTLECITYTLKCLYLIIHLSMVPSTHSRRWRFERRVFQNPILQANLIVLIWTYYS